jgi:hypothetical protein
MASVLALASLLPERPWLSAPVRVCVYGLASLWVWAIERQLTAIAPVVLTAATVFYALLAVAIALVWKLSRGEQEFTPTTMDFLIAVVAIAATFLAGDLQASAQIAVMVVKIVLMLYACELIFSRAGRRAREALTLAGFVAAALALINSA